MVGPFWHPRPIFEQDAVVLQSNTKSPIGVHRPFIK